MSMNKLGSNTPKFAKDVLPAVGSEPHEIFEESDKKALVAERLKVAKMPKNKIALAFMQT